MAKTLLASRFLYSLLIVLFVWACSKPDEQIATDCSSKNILVTTINNPASAPNNGDGSITATATGSNNFMYSINGGTFQTSASFTALTAGSYTIVAKDGSNCTGSTTVNLVATACPTITVTGVVTNTTNPTTANGSIVASATGSTNISFSINNGTFQTSGSFTGLPTGSYTITAKNNNGCTGSTLFTVSAASCPTITVTGSATQTSGPTATDGSITASAAGGVPPYSYSINGTNFQASGSFTNLASNSYTVIARDANGCTGSSSAITVSSAPCATISFTTTVVGSDKCSNNTGRITVMSGGAGLMYNLNGGTFQSSNIFNNLTTGNFTVGVRNSVGCTNTASATVGIAADGPTFAPLKALMIAQCATAGCHAGSNPQSGINFADDCTIVSQASRIKARAVDQSPSVMPPGNPLGTADKQKILDWIAAGAKQSN